jgi:triacylglycerol lipase
MRFVAAIAALLCLVLAAPAAAEEPPPGANDWSCQPSAAHPNPVVLVHGLGANMSANWWYMSPLLKQRGYCVFALTYGVDPRAPVFGGVVPMEQSAEELGAFVDRVLAATGAANVDLVGHSEGTVMPRYWLKFLGGAAKTKNFVALTPLWRGTDFLGAATLYRLAAPFGISKPVVDLVAQFCGSCPQFLTGSEFLAKLNEGGEAAPGVIHTNIATRYELLVIPYTSGIMNDPTARNFVLQDVCALDFSDHISVAFDPVAARLVLNALDPASAREPRCVPVLPLVGGGPLND